MTLIFSGFLLALFGLSLILITLSLRYLRREESLPDGSGSLNNGARFFLITLRLAIGWHCFIEGMEKIDTPNWSSEGYLRESIGPLSGVYRGIAGDRLFAKLTVDADGAFPAELDREWAAYVRAFADYYELDGDQILRAEEVFAKRKKEALKAWATPTSVVKITPYPPEVKEDMTLKQRLSEQLRLRDKVFAVEAKFPTDDKKVHADWKSAKADLAKWRGELKKTVDGETAELKKALSKAVPLPGHGSMVPIQEPHSTPPIGSWGILEWSDAIVKWGLVVLGACLMLGLLSRVASLAAALLVLSFYLAMPSLPGWPESPKLEGHYLVINKTLIEVIALLALTFIPTGRWAGLDALWCLCCRGKAKS